MDKQIDMFKSWNTTEQYKSTTVKHNIDQPQGHDAARIKTQNNEYCMIVYMHLISYIFMSKKKPRTAVISGITALEVGD